METKLNYKIRGEWWLVSRSSFCLSSGNWNYGAQNEQLLPELTASRHNLIKSRQISGRSARLSYLTMNTFTYRKRAFLSPVSTGFTSYVFAEVESSDGGAYRLGNYILILADCHRRVELEFFLGTARDRRQSLAKLDLLIEVLTAFRSALAREAQLIADYEGGDKHAWARRMKTKKLFRTTPKQGQG